MSKWAMNESRRGLFAAVRPQPKEIIPEAWRYMGRVERVALAVAWARHLSSKALACSRWHTSTDRVDEIVSAAYGDLFRPESYRARAAEWMRRARNARVQS
jgi:hypothetical protein